jgi:hypothetical protein
MQPRGLGDFVSSLASAIQNYEGWFPPGSPGYPQGSLSYRNNNPGNLRPGSLAVGATGSNSGYAVFPSYQAGLAALIGLIQSNQYYGDTLTQFFQTYAPSADNNNPAAYAAGVAAQLGVDANTPISQLEAGAAAPVVSSDDSDDSDVDDGTDGNTTYGSTPSYSTGTANLSLPGGLPGGDGSSTASFADTVSDSLGGVNPWLLAGIGGLLLLAAVL